MRSLKPIASLLQKVEIGHAPSALVLGIALSGSPGWSQTLSTAAIAKKASPAIVLIQGVNTKGVSTYGTGFLVSSDGKIVTALHVIEDFAKGTCRLANGEVFDTFTVLAFDKRRDLAILKIPGFDLPTVELGNSNKVLQGDTVLLIGNPEGLQGTVTAGIVSAIRDTPFGGDYKVIQTDASTNPGNSGGPLLNSAGLVVGVLDSKMKSSENLNFALPINYVRGMLKDSLVPISLDALRAKLNKTESESSESTASKPTEVDGGMKYVAKDGLVTNLTLDQAKQFLRAHSVPILDEPSFGDSKDSVVVMMAGYKVVVKTFGTGLRLTLSLTDKIPLLKINKWNEANAIVVLFQVSSDESTMAEMDVYFGDGMTEQNLNSYLSLFQLDVPKIIQHLQEK